MPEHVTIIVNLFPQWGAIGPWVAFHVNEGEQSTDLNGDGDTDDDVLHVFNAVTGQTKNSGIASGPTALGEVTIVTVGNWFAFMAEEWKQDVDYNNNGWANDRVVLLYNVETEEVLNTGLAVGAAPGGLYQAYGFDHMISTGTHVAILAEEYYQGADLNGDSDQTDAVVHVYDPATEAATNLALAGDTRSLVDVAGRVAFQVNESHQGEDLDSDPGLTSHVLHIYDPVTTTVTNTGLPVGGIALELGDGASMGTRGMVAAGDYLAFAIDESRFGDLNGDGSINDDILQIYDTVDNTRFNTGLEEDVTLIAIEHRFAFGTYAGTVHTYDPITGTLVDSGLEGETLTAVGENLALEIPEYRDAVDLNGDGDTADRVLHAFDPVTGKVANSGIAFGFTHIVGTSDQIVFGASESWQGQDFNSDGDIVDTILYVWVPDFDAIAVDTFVDDDDSIFEADIEWLAAAGITRGCNPPINDRFCPNDYVTRGHMAAFLVRALGYSDDGGGDLFVDDDGSVFESDIDRLGTAGVTRGCNPPINDRFCPNDPVTRGQMAAFLHRALG